MADLYLMKREMKGYLLEFTDTCGRYEHIFCGQNDLAGAECPNCNKKLLRFLKVDLGDSQIEPKLIGVRFVSLLYCWTCNISQGHFFYQLADDNTVRILKYSTGGVVSDFPFPNYPEYFPQSFVKLREISDEVQNRIALLNHGEADEWLIRKEAPWLSKPQHQIGGEPYGIDLDRGMKCPQCGKLMQFFATIADTAPGGISMTGNEYVQVMYYLCRKCRTVGAYQQCD